MTGTLLSWSSGKDSAWTLQVLRQRHGDDVAGLFTTLAADSDRVASHEVRRALVEAQGRALGLPVDFIPLPQPCSNAEYEAAMSRFMDEASDRGITRFAYGDLQLADVRRYREQSMQGSGIEPVFPIFGKDTRALARAMVEAGLRAVLVSVDTARLPAAFAGREFSADLLADLPGDVDPCGENGEFHTFVTNGPMFRHPVAVRVGETFERAGLVYADLLPV